MSEENNKSVIGSFYTLSACLDKVPDMKFEDWKAINDNQLKYLEIYKNCQGAVIPEIESKVSVGDVEPINEFLRKKGFDIQLDPIAPRDLAIASVFELFLEWLKEGKADDVKYNDVMYKAVRLSAGVRVGCCGTGFLGYGLDKLFNDGIAVIQTKNGDTIYMTVPAVAPKDSFEVFDMAKKLVSAYLEPSEKYENEVTFPEVDLNTYPDISWIVGLGDRLGEKWQIGQALQQTKVKIDKKGVVVKEAVAMGVMCMCCSFDVKRPLMIDKPFLFVVVRKGLKEPLFSAYLNTDGWIKEKVS